MLKYVLVSVMSVAYFDVYLPNVYAGGLTVMLAVQLLLILLQPSEIGNGIWLLFKHHGMYCFHTVLRKCNGASYHV